MCEKHYMVELPFSSVLISPDQWAGNKLTLNNTKKQTNKKKDQKKKSHLVIFWVSPITTDFFLKFGSSRQ